MNKLIKHYRGMVKCLALILLMLWSLDRAGGASSSPASKATDFNRDIRPILSENCYPCHGPDSNKRKAGLRLDLQQGALMKLKSDNFAIVPDHPEQSALVERITATNEDDRMPPLKTGKHLTEAQIDGLKRWIGQGAQWKPFWSFIKPERPELPRIKEKRWPRNPVDYFILAWLEQENLKPAAEADHRTLIRRVSFDLTGLPPTPEEVEAFVKDKSPDAYEKVVDHLLASPRWGEHRARYWLDAARYGDTHGIHFDNYREMWLYRDWVINSFNANMKFDEFTLEQLAGDLFPNATRDQKIASGFNRCNVTSNEAGLIDDEYLVLYARDRTETTSQVWLGLTTGCAVCHDHKYDPIPQKDFYSLSAFFNNTTQKAKDDNIKDTTPVLVIPKAADEKRWAELPGAESDVEKQIAQRNEAQEVREKFTNWLAQPDFGSLETNASNGVPAFRAPLDEGTNAVKIWIAGEEQNLVLATNVVWQEGVVAASAYTTGPQPVPALANVGDFSRDDAFSCAVWVKSDGTNLDGSICARMEDKNGHLRGWSLDLYGGKPIVHLIADWAKNAIQVICKNELPKGRWNHLAFTYDGSSKGDGVNIFVNGEHQEADVAVDSLSQGIRTAAPFKIGQRDSSSKLEGVGLEDLQIYSRELNRNEERELACVPRMKWLAAKSVAERKSNENEELFGFWLTLLDASYQDALGLKEQLAKEEREIRKRATVTHIMQERTNAPEAYVLFRGQYDQRRDRVTPNSPSALPPMAPDEPRNRLGFAEWLVRPDNPLMARVTVNRFWQELFGTGLVRTAGDFGAAGEPPSHPDLLDWLAVEFRESGWDVKHMYKLMVMSATYRQSAVLTPEKLEKDPQNRLLARGPRFRMDAEMIRDEALESSGLLVEKIGGPSVKPYQPPGVWEVVGMPDGNTRHYQQDTGENLYRRSVYTFWKRQAAPASMEIFNAPSRETCTVRRERTDTPLQALVTLNDPQFVEAARHLAQIALIVGPGDVAARLDFMAERLMARPLRLEEKKIVESSLGDLLTQYQNSPDAAADLLVVGESKADAKLDPPTLAAYTMVANELMNLDEVLNK